MLFDVFNDEVGALVVGDVGGVFGVVHGVGKVAEEDAFDAPFGHLADGEGAVENAHVGVDAGDEQVFDAAEFQGAVDLFSFVGDEVVGADFDSGVLAGPGFVGLVAFGVAAAVGVIDGEFGGGESETCGRGEMRP